MARLRAVRGVVVTVHRKLDDKPYEELRPFLEDKKEDDETNFILVDDEEVPTYSRCCYIRADGNDEFYVKVTFTNDFKYSGYSVRVWTYTDGKFADAVIGNTKQIARKNGLKKKSVGWRKGEGEIKHFCFTHLKMTDDPAEVDLYLPEAGTIEVKLWRIISERGGRTQRFRPDFPKNADDGFVLDTEKMREKQVTLGVGGGSHTQGRALRYPKVTHIDGRDRPFAVFKFLFREKDSLDALGVPTKMCISSDCPLPAPRETQGRYTGNGVATNIGNVASMDVAQLRAALYEMTGQTPPDSSSPANTTDDNNMFIDDSGFDDDDSDKRSDAFRHAQLRNSRCYICSGNLSGSGELCVQHWNSMNGNGGSGDAASPNA